MFGADLGIVFVVNGMEETKVIASNHAQEQKERVECLRFFISVFDKIICSRTHIPAKRPADCPIATT